MTRTHGVSRTGRFARKSSRPRAAALVAAVLLCSLVLPLCAQARDLVVYGDPTLRPVLTVLGSLWRARSGKRVHVFVAPTDLSFGQIERDTRCDVIFALVGPSLDAAAGKPLFDAESRVDVFTNSLALVGRQAASGDLARLVAGKRLALANPDRDVAGAYAIEALRRAGITIDPMSRDVAVAENSLGVLQMLGDRNAEIGIVFATDAAAQSQFPVLARLDKSMHPTIAYMAAEALNADASADPEEFLDFLRNQAHLFT